MYKQNPQVKNFSTSQNNSENKSQNNFENNSPEKDPGRAPLPASGAYPATRLRRNRKTQWSRDLVAQTSLTVRDLIWPLFVIEGQGEKEAIPAMPDVYRYSIDLIIDQAKAAQNAGIPALALFPITDPARKTADGREAYNPDNLICRTIAEIKSAVPDIGLIVDVALDPYTDHGHDGVIGPQKGGGESEILNDATLDILAQQALVQAQAGADIIAPSDMMDGRVGFIRAALEQNGFHHTQIMAYSAKYASAFYGPFREAVQSKGCLKGDKKTYQMDPANGREALREIAMDIEEGADMVMVKPGLPYLDIVRDAKNHFDVPVMAYNVSGEYSMLKLACAQGILDPQTAIPEMLLSFKRAGADGILTYFALNVAQNNFS